MYGLGVSSAWLYPHIFSALVSAAFLVLAECFQPGGQLPDELQLRLIHLFGAILSGAKVGWGHG